MNNRSRVVLFTIIGLAAIITVLLIIKVSTPSDIKDNKTAHESTPGKFDSELFFDVTAPIPIRSGDRYGFASSDGKSWVIRPIYVSVERYYGNYAKVEAENGTYRLLDRNGAIVFESNYSNGIHYDIDGNVWIINGVIYDSVLKALSPENANSSYIGNGYMLVISDEDGTAYLYTLDGKNIYDCGEADCTAMIAEDNTAGKKYAVFYLPSIGYSKVIELGSGQEVFSSRKGTYLIKYTDDILIERRSSDLRNMRLISLRNGDFEASSIPEVSKKTENTDFNISLCSNGYYMIKKEERELYDCELTDVAELSERVFEYFKTRGKGLILVIKDGTTQLYDTISENIIKTYDSDSITTFNDSPLIRLSPEGDNDKICSLISEKCIEIPINANMDANSNYFVLNDRVYTLDFEEIKL